MPRSDRDTDVTVSLGKTYFLIGGKVMSTSGSLEVSETLPTLDLPTGAVHKKFRMVKTLAFPREKCESSTDQCEGRDLLSDTDGRCPRSASAQIDLPLPDVVKPPYPSPIKFKTN